MIGRRDHLMIPEVKMVLPTLLLFLAADHHPLLHGLVLGMEAQTVGPAGVVPVQIAEAVIVMTVSKTRSLIVIVVKNLTVRLLAAGMAELREAAGSAIQLGKQKGTRRLTGIGIETVFEIDMVTKRKSETVTKTAEKGTASEIVNESETAIATVTGIGTVETIKTVTGTLEKNETLWFAIVPVLPHQGLIAVVCLIVPKLLLDNATYQMAMRPLVKGEDPLTMR
jgi:hypothetical protein